jgi:dihydroorotate dehydrogenase electron transfer subunit
MNVVQIKSEITSNFKITQNYYKMTLEIPTIAKIANPGQFLHLRVNDGYDPLLRRPFSIHRLRDLQIDILYEVIGRGTRILSEKKPGEYLDILGPLGNGFDIKSNIKNQKSKILLVAGGIGVAPFPFLAEELKKSKLEVVVLIGAKTKKRLLCEKEFKDLGCEVEISTDDGSKGFKGKITDSLKNLLLTVNYRLSTIYACGPKEMLKEVSEISKKYKISAFGSLEENLGCGIGACLGCVVKTRNGYKRICKEGPVFDLKEVIW